MSSTAAVLPSKERLSGALKRHFFLRVHMFVILGGTVTIGLLTTKILLITHERNLALRYGVAVCIAFAAFVGFIKLWLGYVGFCAKRSRGSGDWGDFVDFACDGVDFGGGGGGDASDFASGGGRFGGGGASGSWGSADPVVAPLKGSSSSSSGGGFSLGNLDLGDDAGIIILVALLVLAIAGAAFYVVWAAPAILSETAFQATLAAALARRARKISNGSWVGSVVRATLLPFLIVLALAVTLGWYAQKHCPSATRLREAMHCVATTG